MKQFLKIVLVVALRVTGTVRMPATSEGKRQRRTGRYPRGIEEPEEPRVHFNHLKWIFTLWLAPLLPLGRLDLGPCSVCKHSHRRREPYSSLRSPLWASLPFLSTMHSLFWIALVPSFTMALKFPVRQIRRDGGVSSNKINALRSFNNFAVMDQDNTIS